MKYQAHGDAQHDAEPNDRAPWLGLVVGDPEQSTASPAKPISTAPQPTQTNQMTPPPKFSPIGRLKIDDITTSVANPPNTRPNVVAAMASKVF